MNVSGRFIVHRSSFIASLSFLLDHFDEVGDLRDHPADFLRIGALGDAIHLSETESLERLPHLERATDTTADLADFDLLRCGAHASPSVALSPLPRSDLYCSSLRSCLSASNVALTTLCGFAVPSDFVRMF